MKSSPIKSQQLYNIVTKKKINYYISNNVHLKIKTTQPILKKGQLS
jgi:hypothetical protein